MKFDIDPDIVAEARFCKKWHICLTGDQDLFCKAKPDGGNLFITCQEDNTCPYRVNAGDKITCACPVRQEIFKKHGV